jgi:hypothetical protein
MDHKKTTIITLLISLALVMTAAVPVQALEVNKSGLWFGGDKGIEVLWKSGENLAYTDDSPLSSRSASAPTWPTVGISPAR